MAAPRRTSRPPSSSFPQSPASPWTSLPRRGECPVATPHAQHTHRTRVAQHKSPTFLTEEIGAASCADEAVETSDGHHASAGEVARNAVLAVRLSRLLGLMRSVGPPASLQCPSRGGGRARLLFSCHACTRCICKFRQFNCEGKSNPINPHVATQAQRTYACLSGRRSDGGLGQNGRFVEWGFQEKA